MAELIEANAPPRPKSRTRLALLLGSPAAAAALFVLVPAEESGRVTKATVQPDGGVTLQHVSGRQYLNAYLDIVRVPTICDGVTEGVTLGQVRTPEQCADQLEEQIVRHAAPVLRCVPTLKGRPNQIVAAVSLSYNIGPAGVCQSSIARLWRAGQWRAGCDRFPLFNKAGGRVVRGLVDRRARERAICLRGLA